MFWVLRYQFPMGKVKARYSGGYPLSGKEYQFPMGKVKFRALFRDGEMVVYQFPMGKVKLRFTQETRAMSCFVSIPYGKGKEQHFVLCLQYTPNI